MMYPFFAQDLHEDKVYPYMDRRPDQGSWGQAPAAAYIFNISEGVIRGIGPCQTYVSSAYPDMVYESAADLFFELEAWNMASDEDMEKVDQLFDDFQ